MSCCNFFGRGVSINISRHVSIDGHAFLYGSIINIDKNKIEKSRCILFR